MVNNNNKDYTKKTEKAHIEVILNKAGQRKDIFCAQFFNSTYKKFYQIMDSQ